MKKYLPYVFCALAFLGPFSLYLYHLSPVYIPIDSAEFTLCMEFWGLCHPPGFPLYVMLGHFFLMLFPFGEEIYKANLLSAIFGALTTLFVYLILTRLEVKRELAILGSLFLCVTTSFWEFSLSADVFTFGTFLVSLSLLLAFYKRVLLSIFVLGLSASHFYLTAVIFPIYIWYFQARKIQQIFLMGLVFASGFFPQVIMYLRMQMSPEINWGHAHGVEGFINYVRRKEFGSGFLLSNPALVYSPIKNFKQIGYFLKTLFFEFGLILPVLSFAGIFIPKLKVRREFLLIAFSFAVFAMVQLFLLSTIDPGGEGNPFQLNKFYLVPFLLSVLLALISLDTAVKRYLREFSGIFISLLCCLIAIYLMVNWQTVSFRNNYFSRNLVLDAIGQLPQDSIAITVDHVMFFGTLYEQKVGGVHTDKTILYFPNEKNRDNEYYNPAIFEGQENREFIERIESEYKLGAAEKYVLSTISKNLDRDIYILQGEFEYNFFQYLSGVVEPWGLWIRIKRDGREVRGDELVRLFEDTRNKDFKKEQFFLKQQGFEASVYAISYYQSALKLASMGQYTHALSFFERSLEIDSTKTNVANDVSLVKRVQQLSQKEREFQLTDQAQLLELAQGLATVKNYKESSRIYDQLLEEENPSASVYNGAASVYASLGENEKARGLWEQALVLDPNLDFAKRGLDNLK